MAVIEVFSRGVCYKYRSRICSVATATVLAVILGCIASPLVVISKSGGVWMKNVQHIETPEVSFEYKYLLLAEKGEDVNPTVCSTFTTYKENVVADQCSAVKVQEVDSDSDGTNDSLKFEAQFYTDRPVKSIKLLLFFDFLIKEPRRINVKSIAEFDHTATQVIKELSFGGDLELSQKGILKRHISPEEFNKTIDLADYTLPELLTENENRLFVARIRNLHATVKTGFTVEEPFVLSGELNYAESIIHYQPTVWQEMRYAWIQYVSVLAFFAFFGRRVLKFLFNNKYVYAYVVVPWEEKIE